MSYDAGVPLLSLNEVGLQIVEVFGRAKKIGDDRWRIVFPYPHYESTLDVIELIPEQ